MLSILQVRPEAGGVQYPCTPPPLSELRVGRTLLTSLKNEKCPETSPLPQLGRQWILPKKNTTKNMYSLYF